LEHALEVLADEEALAQRAAGFVAGRARAAVADTGKFTFAISGGRTPWAMFAMLAGEEVPWRAVEIFQVDERVAPEGDPDRNLTHLHEALRAAPATVVPMGVNDTDLERAAAAYAELLPDHFDLVHLGLGPDGHTASLVPGDPVLDVTDRLVSLTLPYQGHPRMTLTYPALARAEQIVWLVAGKDKSKPLARLLSGDRTIPAGRVTAAHSLIFADADADS
jgi:6-phosphogluconolactonase